MARTYAISHQNQPILAVLGTLFLGSNIPNIVCDHSHDPSSHVINIFFQVIAVTNSCSSTGAESQAINLFVFQYFILKLFPELCYSGVGGIIPLENVVLLSCSSEETLGTIFGLAFDTFVIAVTLYQTWWVLKLQNRQELGRKSLTSLLVQQGEWLLNCIPIGMVAH